MRSIDSWGKRFTIQTLLWAIAIVLTVLLSEAIALPLLRWIVLDEWQWAPLNRWVRYVVLGAIGGIVPGAFFTTYEWLVQTPASLPRKVLTTVAVVALCAVLVVVGREYVGRMTVTQRANEIGDLTHFPDALFSADISSITPSGFKIQGFVNASVTPLIH